MQTQCFYPNSTKCMCSFTEEKKISPTIYNGFFKKSSEN